MLAIAVTQSVTIASCIRTVGMGISASLWVSRSDVTPLVHTTQGLRAAPSLPEYVRVFTAAIPALRRWSREIPQCGG